MQWRCNFDSFNNPLLDERSFEDREEKKLAVVVSGLLVELLQGLPLPSKEHNLQALWKGLSEPALIRIFILAARNRYGVLFWQESQIDHRRPG